jgi:hypothetical protein
MHALTSQFSYNAKDKTFVADASDLPDSVFEQVFPDSADTGIKLVSHKTWKESIWYLTYTVRNTEGEVTGWELRPTPMSRKQIPSLANAKMIIFND